MYEIIHFPDEGHILKHFIGLHVYLALDNEKLVIFSNLTANLGFSFTVQCDLLFRKILSSQTPIPRKVSDSFRINLFEDSCTDENYFGGKIKVKQY